MGNEDVWMHVSTDHPGRRLRLTIPPDQIAEVVAQLRSIAQVADDPIAATRVRRLLMQLRGQEDEVTLRAIPEDFVLLLDWGLQSARDELNAVLDTEIPNPDAAEGAFERVRWYLGALAELEALDSEAEPEETDDDVEVEPLAARRGRWPTRTGDEQALPAAAVARPA